MKLTIGYKKFKLGYQGYLKLIWGREWSGSFRLCPHDALVDAAKLRCELLEENGVTDKKLLKLAGCSYYAHIELALEKARGQS